MTIDPKFLKDAQAAGWIIHSADKDKLMAMCPKAGCGLTLWLKPGRPIPDACKRGPEIREHVVEGFESARKFLRARRDDLALTIKEVEEACGIPNDFAAKFEKDNPSKIPNAETFIEWAQGMGYEVVLRYKGMPPLMLRYIADSRDRVAARRKMQPHHQRRRGLKREGQE